MTEGSPLGAFLRERRARLRPEDVGVHTNRGHRRVPGLRREELAMLAGISASYYIRLEQGSSPTASAQVLDSLARALRLDEVERQHLHDLAAAGHPQRRKPHTAPERISPATRQLIDAFGDTPVVVLGRRYDVLAWNPTGHALFAGHLNRDDPDDPARRPNAARQVFLDAHSRDLYLDWPVRARAIAGKLRQAAGRNPDDPLLAALIGELIRDSSEFATIWAEHQISTWDVSHYRLRHPLVGDIDVMAHMIDVPHSNGTRIVAATAAPGSASRAAMSLLTQSVHTLDDLTQAP
jgi:transcriptional regulator with XRE-family HTH domain